MVVVAVTPPPDRARAGRRTRPGQLARYGALAVEDADGDVGGLPERVGDPYVVPASRRERRRAHCESGDPGRRRSRCRRPRRGRGRRSHRSGHRSIDSRLVDGAPPCLNRGGVVQLHPGKSCRVEQRAEQCTAALQIAGHLGQPARAPDRGSQGELGEAEGQSHALRRGHLGAHEGGRRGRLRVQVMHGSRWIGVPAESADDAAGRQEVLKVEARTGIEVPCHQDQCGL